MSRAGVFLCECSEGSSVGGVDELARCLKEAGVRVHLIPSLCTHRGLRVVHDRIVKDDLNRIVFGACGPEMEGIRWLVQDLGCRWAVVDIHGEQDPGISVSVIKKAIQDLGGRPGTSDASQRVLIVGGGVAGVQAALDATQAGYPVTVVEASPSIGGVMARLDKTFPTMDCSICILGPKLAEVGSHPDIEVLSHSRVKEISGEAGNFLVTVETAPRYIDMTKCNGCGRCAEVCPVVVPNAWDCSLKPRKAIYISFAQSVPLRSSIDIDHCIRCEMCVRVCEREAINFEDEAKTRTRHVGAVVLAPGIELFDASRMTRYGYGRLENVLTNLDFERVVCASGPTEGRLIRQDGKRIERLAFVQCVGSRDIHHHEYCSAYCCMATIKQAMLVKERDPASEVSVFYNDIRAGGKGFQEFYDRARKEGIRFIKSLPGAIEGDPDRKVLKIQYEDLGSFQLKKMEVDMAVLATAMEPTSEYRELARIFRLDLDPWGFFQERHPSLGPVETTREGIYLAGTCVGPKDIPESVGQGSAVAAKICRLFHGRESE